MTGEDGPPGLTEEPPRPRARRYALVAVLATVAVAAVAAALAAGPSRNESPRLARLEETKPAPRFDLPALSDPGKRVKLADFDGKPLVVNFWASWCVPCRKEMPAFQAAAARLRASVAFVGVNNRDSRDDALKFLRDTGVTYPSGYDPRGDTARDYSLLGMPTTVFVTPDGQIAAVRTGEVSAEELDKTLAELFPEAVGRQ